MSVRSLVGKLDAFGTRFTPTPFIVATNVQRAIEAAANIGLGISGKFPAVSTDNAVARYDGLVGSLQNSGVIISDTNDLSPAANDGGALGTTALKWSDLHLASGGVINFNAGDVTITHSADLLAFAGAATGYTFTGGPIVPATNDAVALGTTALGFADLFLATGGTLHFANTDWVATHTTGILTVGTGDLRVTNAGTNAASVVTVGGTQTLTNKQLTAATVNTSFTPTANDGSALGTTALGFADLFLATGGTLHFANTDWVATHTTGILTVGTGDLRVTNAGTNSASVVTVGGTQTLTGKSLSLSQVTGLGTGVATMLASNTAPTISITFIIDGGGSAITTGIKGDLEIPFACTITKWTLLADQSGSIVLDLWKDTFANYPPTVADTITAAAKPTISTSTKGQSSTLTGWTTTVAAGDTIRFNVDSITTCQRVTLSLTATKT